MEYLQEQFWLVEEGKHMTQNQKAGISIAALVAIGVAVAFAMGWL